MCFIAWPHHRLFPCIPLDGVEAFAKCDERVDAFRGWEGFREEVTFTNGF